jgi:hypothetical protein
MDGTQRNRNQNTLACLSNTKTVLSAQTSLIYLESNFAAAMLVVLFFPDSGMTEQ